MTIKRKTTVTVETTEKIGEYSFYLSGVNGKPSDLHISSLHKKDVHLDHEAIKSLKQFFNNLDEFEKGGIHNDKA